MPIEKSQLRKPREHLRLIGHRTRPPMLAGDPQRQSLVDLFHEFSKSPAEFLQYDNGYRSWKYTYAQVGRAACHFAMRLGEHKDRQGRQSHLLV